MNTGETAYNLFSESILQTRTPDGSTSSCSGIKLGYRIPTISVRCKL
jgi:hypothetical protein